METGKSSSGWVGAAALGLGLLMACLEGGASAGYPGPREPDRGIHPRGDGPGRIADRRSDAGSIPARTRRPRDSEALLPDSSDSRLMRWRIDAF